MAKSSHGERIKSVQRSWEIIRLLQQQPMGVTQIADKVGISPGSVYKHLATLSSLDLVYKNDSGDYSLGYKMLKISNGIRNNSLIFRVAKPELDKLARQYGFCVHLLVEHNCWGVYVYNHMNELAPNHSILGKREPLHVSAGGKSLLAFMNHERRIKIYEEVGLPQWTENTTTDVSKLEKELEEVRKEGVAFNDEETFKGHRAVASPVQNSDGKPICAISVSESVGEFNDERFRTTIPEIVQKVVKYVELNYQLKSSD